MVVSKQQQTVFLRIPKTGSTSVAFYLLDSGLISDEDMFGNKTAKKAKRMVLESSPETSGYSIKDEPTIANHSHRRHKDIIIDYPFLRDYKSIAVLRNPVSRIVSAATMFQKEQTVEQLNKTVELLLSSRSILSVPQFEFIGEETILWTTESLKNSIENYILDNGGRVRGEWRCRSNGSADYMSMLSSDNLSKIKDVYAKDFELWRIASSYNKT